MTFENNEPMGDDEIPVLHGAVLFGVPIAAFLIIALALWLLP